MILSSPPPPADTTSPQYTNLRFVLKEEYAHLHELLPPFTALPSSPRCMLESPSQQERESEFDKLLREVEELKERETSETGPLFDNRNLQIATGCYDNHEPDMEGTNNYGLEETNDYGSMEEDEQDQGMEQRQEDLSEKTARLVKTQTGREKISHGITSAQFGRCEIKREVKRSIGVEAEGPEEKLAFGSDKLAKTASISKSQELIEKEKEGEHATDESDNEQEWETVYGGDSEVEEEHKKATQDDEGWETMDDEDDGDQDMV